MPLPYWVIQLLMHAIHLLGIGTAWTVCISSLADDVGPDYTCWVLCIDAVYLVLLDCTAISDLAFGLTITASVFVVKQQWLRTSSQRH